MSSTNPTGDHGRPWYADLDNVTELCRWMHDEGRVFSFNDALHVYEHPHRYDADWRDYQDHLAALGTDRRLLAAADDVETFGSPRS